ncbi:hypothetical protein DL96DRAFT_900534 [Flagelloscypha sp. PMI_526]|nr:hypothetical protein DL96DRAFT_900534 [Flagelloscypha sp. PMI_526]
MTVPQELVPLICSFSDQCTLSSICLTSKAFSLDAGVALYADISFVTSRAVEGFLLNVASRLNLTKHLSLYIPSLQRADLEIWMRLFAAVRQASVVKELRVTSSPILTSPPGEFKTAAGHMLSIPSLEYVAVATSIIPATIAIRCPALKELDMRASTDTQGLTKPTETQQPKLNTLCLASPNVSPLVLPRVFNLSSLRRLALVHSSSPYGMPMFQLLGMTCGSLEDLSLWLHSPMDKTYIAEIRKFTLPNLQTFTLLCSENVVKVRSLEVYDVLVSTLVNISGPLFKELRLYLHSCDPSTILRGNGLYIPQVSPQITVLRFYCWSSNPLPPGAAEAETLLKRHLGSGRELSVVWSRNWSSLTYFCES